MSKISINIDIELDSADTKVPGILAALAGAFNGAPVTINTTTKATAPVVEKTKAEEPKEEPKADEPKEEPKAKKPVAKKPVAKEPTWEPGGGPVTDEPEKTEAPTTPTYTIDEVRNITAEAKRSGKPTSEIRSILKKHGAAIVSDLKPEAYASFVADIKAL